MRSSALPGRRVPNAARLGGAINGAAIATWRAQSIVIIAPGLARMIVVIDLQLFAD